MRIVIVYENNSTDNSALILKKWAEKNSRVIIISEYLSHEELHARTRAHAKRDQAPCRMELIAYARNKVLDQMLREEYKDFDYVVMTDMDFMQGWSVKDVVNACNTATEWDCITANGMDMSTYYYDRYAYRDDQFLLGPELIGEEFWYELGKTPIRFLRGSGLKKVYSAFGGVAIYKRNSLQGCRYDGYITDDLKKFMGIALNRFMSKNHPQYKLYKKIINAHSDRLPIIFQANCGYDGPVVCEHSTLHATMFLNGFDKIFVDPNLICKY